MQLQVAIFNATEEILSTRENNVFIINCMKYFYLLNKCFWGSITLEFDRTVKCAGKGRIKINL